MCLFVVSTCLCLFVFYAVCVFIYCWENNKVNTTDEKSEKNTSSHSDLTSRVHGSYFVVVVVVER